MDIEQFIFPENTEFQYDQSAAQQLPHELYDQDSGIEESSTQITVDEVLQILMQKQAFIDTSLHQLIQTALHQYNLSSEKVNQLMKKIKKIKNTMKRNRAKDRQHLNQKSFLCEKKSYVFEESSTEKDTVMIEKQIKKQRNRISAQVSRDRKKQYVVGLEQKNKQLALEAEHLRLENEKLKQQLTQKTLNESLANSNKKNSNKNSKFVRLLVLMGIVFFVYILRDMFNFKATKNSSTFNIDETEQQQNQQGVTAAMVLNENLDIADQIKRQINQIQHDQSDFGLSKLFQSKEKMSLKQSILKKILQIKKKTKQLIMPASLASQIILAKNMLIL